MKKPGCSGGCWLRCGSCFDTRKECCQISCTLLHFQIDLNLRINCALYAKRGTMHKPRRRVILVNNRKLSRAAGEMNSVRICKQIRFRSNQPSSSDGKVGTNVPIDLLFTIDHSGLGVYWERMRRRCAVARKDAKHQLRNVKSSVKLPVRQFRSH